MSTVRSKKWRELAPGSLVFTCSWSDFFHEDADEWREQAWDVIRERSDLTWQILTKRPERMLEHLPADWGDGWPHVWLGVSVENRRFVRRADLLRQVPAAVRFISAEPLLGPLCEWMFCSTCSLEGPDPHCGECEGVEYWLLQDGLDLTDIDWLICGGESGAGHRPMRIEWMRDLLELAQLYETAFFCKQDSGSRPGRQGRIPDDIWQVKEFPSINQEELSA